MPAVAEPVSPTLEAFVVHAVESRRVTAIARPLAKLAFLGRDRAHLELGDKGIELRPRLAEILVMLCARPDGMSAEALCADLHGDGGSVSSVRVEVSRLRKLLGPWIDTDRYRLTCDVETDVRRVEGLLAAGAVVEAAETYPGPLLPSSEAPGVVRERERLDAWMRQAVLTSDAARSTVGVGPQPLRRGRPRRVEAPARAARVPRSAARPVRRPDRRAPCSADVTPEWSTPLRGVMDATRAHRGLSTARAALRVTWQLARRPEGVRADEVAEALGKSVSTAYNVLASLCDEGVAERRPGGLYRLSAEFRETVAEESDRHDLSGVVDDLLARTHKRAYLAVLRGGQLRIVLERGLQGMPKLPGMNPEIADNAHALALGKVVLALGPRDAVEQYARAGPQTLHADRPSPSPTRCRKSCGTCG